MTKCSELKRCVTWLRSSAKVAPLWPGCDRSNAPMCHVADCAFRGDAYYSETEPTQKPAFFGKGPDQGKWTTYANAPSHVHGCVCVLIIPGCIPSGHLFPLRLVTLSSLARPKCQVTCSVYPKKKKKTARLHASNSRPRRSGHKNFVN